MKSRLVTIYALTIASIKMYFRNFTAIFFTIIFPVIFLLIFGFINSGDDLTLTVVTYDEAGTEQSAAFIEALEEVPILEFQNDKYPELEEAQEAISDGGLNFALVINEGFGDATRGPPGGSVTLFIDESNTTFNATFESIVNSILEGFNTQTTIAVTGVDPLETYTLTTESVQAEDLDGIDFLVPGIIGFSILSLGIFSISAGFITYKSNGSLRRLFVTPVGPFSFIVGQANARLIMTVLNVWTMLLLSVLLFDYSVVGGFVTYINFTILSLIGAVLFLGIGFAIAGWAKDENQAAPISNIIFFPLMFLSGTFFPRELFPEWLKPITEILPLSFLTDAYREVTTEGASLIDVWPDIFGMLVWIAIVYFIAVRIFRWE